MGTREFTGKKAAALFIGAFTVIIGVNLILAFSAVKTFPGLEVKNSYVASQEFDAKRDAQSALGWTVKAKTTGGLLILSITDRNGWPVEAASLEATLGRATHVKDDVEPEFHYDGSAYVVPMALEKGNWNIRLKAVAKDGTEFTQRVVLHVTK